MTVYFLYELEKQISSEFVLDESLTTRWAFGPSSSYLWENAVVFDSAHECSLDVHLFLEIMHPGVYGVIADPRSTSTE